MTQRSFGYNYAIFNAWTLNLYKWTRNLQKYIYKNTHSIFGGFNPNILS